MSGPGLYLLWCYQRAQLGDEIYFHLLVNRLYPGACFETQAFDARTHNEHGLSWSHLSLSVIFHRFRVLRQRLTRSFCLRHLSHADCTRLRTPELCIFRP
jgi:hypothetical protein